MYHAIITGLEEEADRKGTVACRPTEVRYFIEDIVVLIILQ